MNDKPSAEVVIVRRDKNYIFSVSPVYQTQPSCRIKSVINSTQVWNAKRKKKLSLFGAPDNPYVLSAVQERFAQRSRKMISVDGRNERIQIPLSCDAIAQLGMN